MTGLELENSDADWPIYEAIKSRRIEGTHLAPDASADALRVDVNGSGTLGTGGNALVVAPGTGSVEGTEHTIADDRTLDVALPGGNDRRDAVILTDAGTLEVREGPGGQLDWGENVASNARTFNNAFVPPPPDLQGVAGLVLAVVTVRSGQNNLDSDAVDSTVRVGPPLAVGKNAINAAGDGKVVAVAPGLGVVDAIDPAATQTPVQDAVLAVEAAGISADGRYGAGAVLLPAGVTETPGGIHSLAGKHIVGFGREGSILRVTDSTADCFTVGGNAGNLTKASMDGFTIDGGDRAARTAGSAINTVDAPPGGSDVNMVSVGFNLGDMQFQNWGGPDPVINGFGSFSARWGYLRATDYDGIFLVGEGFDNRVQQISVNHGTTTEPVVKLDGIFGPVHIDGINCGGGCHRVLYADSTFSRHAALYVPDINVEPDVNNAGTLPPSVAPAPVEIYGAAPAAIGSVHQAVELKSDYTVAIGGSLSYSSVNNDGPANNQLGHILYGDGATVARVGVLDAPKAPSYYWGPREHIDYQGHDQRAVIPEADAATTGQLFSESHDDLADVSASDHHEKTPPTSLTTLTKEGANRTAETWYQNTTGSPMQVSARVLDFGGGRVLITAHVNDTQTDRALVSNSDAGNGTNASAAGTTIIVPSGSYYKMTVTGPLDTWVESTLS